MPKAYCSLSKTTIDKIKSLSEKEGKSFSKVMSDLVELGLKVTLMNDGEIHDNVWEELYHDQVRATLQILEISREVLRMNYVNSESKFKSEFRNVDQLIEGIRKEVNSKIEGKTSKNLA